MSIVSRQITIFLVLFSLTFDNGRAKPTSEEEGKSATSDEEGKWASIPIAVPVPGSVDDVVDVGGSAVGAGSAAAGGAGSAADAVSDGAVGNAVDGAGNAAGSAVDNTGSAAGAAAGSAVDTTPQDKLLTLLLVWGVQLSTRLDRWQQLWFRWLQQL